VIDDGDHPIAFASFKFTPAVTRYSAIERKLLAMVKGIEYFRPNLWNVESLMRTEHKPLLWVGTLREPSARVMKLKEKLVAYKFRLQHTKGL
jgi:putative methionine-R-sulfoxide reductase with GAF domain